MKKSIIPILAVLMLPVSCTRVELPADSAEEQHNEGAQGTVIISARPDADTRAVLKNGTNVAFQGTDSISVFSGTAEGFYNDKFRVKDTYSDGSADFQGTLTEATEDAMVVLYPCQEGATLSKYGPSAAGQRKLSFTLPAVQTATAGSFDPAAFICTGVTESFDDDSLTVSLGTVCALVKFTMPEGSYSKVTLTANGGESLAGACSVSSADGYKGNSSIGITTETYSTVTLSGKIAGGQTYFMAVAPVTAVKGVTVMLFDDEGNLAGEKSTTKEVGFSRNRILNLGTLPGQDENKWLGKGTQDSPYIISCANHLKMLSDAYSTKESAEKYAGRYFKQAKDIDLGGEPFTIGNFMEDVNPSDFHYGAAFNATYDGGGHTIKGYTIKLVDEKPDFTTRRHAAGLFNIVKNGTIKNLTVLPAAGTNNVTMTADDINDALDSYYIGLLAGVVSGNSTISNCRTGKWTYKFYCKDSGGIGDNMDIIVGGLVGATNGVYGDRDARFPTISNCTNEATIIVNDGMTQISVGGILGGNLPANEICYIDRCRNKGKISVTSADAQVFAGGIAGRITNNNELETATYRFSNCVNEGDIEAITTANEYACAGGIIGSHNSDGDWGDDPWFHNCLNKGDIYASGGDDYVLDVSSANAGGICGYCYDGDTKFALCVNVGRVNAEVDPLTAPIVVTDGDQYWCYWLYTDAFDGYEPDGDYYKLFSCYGFITGSGQGTDNPEYVRTHGKAGDDTSGKTLYTETEWNEAQWKAAAEWTGMSDSNWGEEGHENSLDLKF
ncbi:MAG: hypothetical protein MJY84_03410 [Bacteroidales bacterium]|nr:hypothetical protein [Bacteroidales bacterium]